MPSPITRHTTSPVERLAVRSAARMTLVRVDDLDYAEACGN